MKCRFATLACSLFLFLGSSSALWAGGVIQEMNVSPDKKKKEGSSCLSTSAHSSYSEQKHINSSEFMGNKIRTPNMIILDIDDQTNATVLRWTSHKIKGKKANRYLIYKKKSDSEHWILVGDVEGEVSEFSDPHPDQQEHVEYKVVALHKKGHHFEAWQYPKLRRHYPKSLFGIGCQISSHPSSLTWFIFALFPLFMTIVRKRYHHTLTSTFHWP